MRTTKEEILEKFSKEEMADLLVGANLRCKNDKDLIAYLMGKIRELEEELKDVVKNTRRKAKRD